MYAFVTSRELQQQQKKVKTMACVAPVNIGNEYILCSNEVFEAEIRKLADRMSYEREFERTVARGMADIKSGNVFKGSREEILAEIEKRHSALNESVAVSA